MTNEQLVEILNEIPTNRELELKTKISELEFEVESLKTECAKHVKRISQTESNLKSIRRGLNKFRSEFYDLVLREMLREPEWRMEKVDAIPILCQVYELLGISESIGAEADALNIHLDDGPF